LAKTMFCALFHPRLRQIVEQLRSTLRAECLVSQSVIEGASESRFYRFRREPLSFLPVTATAPPGNRLMVTEAMLRRVTPRAARAVDVPPALRF
jgi:hypothetical protein